MIIRKLILWGSALLFSVGANAQNGIEQVLQSIEANNKVLLANQKLTQAQQLEVHTGKFLPNPSAEFEKMWGNKNNPGSEYEFVIKQSIDFPTTYGKRSKLAGMKADAIGFQYAAFRQELLLAAKQTCIEIVYLRKQQALLEKQLKNAKALNIIYQKRLQKGDANQLETTKIQLEALGVQKQHQQNEVILKTALEQLRMLNGGREIFFNDEEYTPEALLSLEELQAQYLSIDPTLRTLTEEQEIAQREVNLNRSLALPKIDFGYKHRSAGDNISANGIVFGISLPLFEHKNTVKRAKAQAAFASVAVEESRLRMGSELEQLYGQLLAISRVKEEYSSLLESQQSVELFNKALEAKQLSIIEYFSELSTFYDSMQSYLEVEKEYHDLVAQLNRYKL